MSCEVALLPAEKYCKQVTDGTHDSPKPTVTGKYLITSKHLSRYKLDFESAYKVSIDDYNKIIERSVVNQYDILYSMIGTVGNIYQEMSSNIEYAIKNVGLFKCDNYYESKWLYYYLQTTEAKEYIYSNLKGSTQKYISLGALREMPIRFIIDTSIRNKVIPCLHTMYIDKPMSGHNLMQAIARVNRVFKDKPGGLVVDYIGIADNLRSALSQYTPSDRKTAGIDPQIAVDLMVEKYEQIKGMLHGLDYGSYIDGTASQRMDCIVKGVDFILGKDDDDRKDFLNFVVEIGKAYALCSTSEKAQEINLEISFFKAVKAGVVKILPTDKPKKTKDQIEYEIGQLVSKSVISEEVVDILASVGLNKPDISILSDEFLEEVKGLPQKNLALELLRRLLDGKIKAIAKKNIVQAKKFSEMLESSVNQYTKRSLETAEVIKALVDMAKDMNNLHKRGEKLGLSDDELAFYDAISENESARDFYENDVLKQIAKELTISIKSNMKVDWDVRESVRAQMRITIKRLLRKYKYPPDKQADAVTLIIEQAEKMCENEMH